MEQKKAEDIFDEDIVFFSDLEIESSKKPWYQHPECKGVFLKDLVSGKDTSGRFSYHLVKVWKNCEVSDHSHDTRWEWNRIIGGSGVFILGDKEVGIKPGQTFVTPPGIHHTVGAYDEDLSLLALFIPALV